MCADNNTLNLNKSFTQERKRCPSAPKSGRKVAKQELEKKIQAKRRLEHHKKMQSTLFRVYIRSLLTSEEAKMDFRNEWEKEKAYNKKHNLKMWLR